MRFCIFNYFHFSKESSNFFQLSKESFSSSFFREIISSSSSVSCLSRTTVVGPVGFLLLEASPESQHSRYVLFFIFSPWAGDWAKMGLHLKQEQHRKPSSGQWLLEFVDEPPLGHGKPQQQGRQKTHLEGLCIMKGSQQNCITSC